MMLGDLGARVIKVENPDGGDDTRGGLCQRLAEAASRQLPAQLPAQLT